MKLKNKILLLKYTDTMKVQLNKNMSVFPVINVNTSQIKKINMWQRNTKRSLLLAVYPVLKMKNLMVIIVMKTMKLF